MPQLPEGHGRLVLDRVPGESLMIGDDIRISVRKVRLNHVVLVIEAPKSVPIVRDDARKLERSKP